MEDSRFFLQNSLLPVVVVCDDNDGVPPRTVLVSSSRLGYFEDAARRLVTTVGKNDRTMREIELEEGTRVERR